MKNLEIKRTIDVPRPFLIAKKYPNHGPCHYFLSESRRVLRDKDSAHRFAWVDWHFKTPLYLKDHDVVRCDTLTAVATVIRKATETGHIKADDNIVVLYESLSEV